MTKARKIAVAALGASALLLALAATAATQAPRQGRATLDGYQEIPTISTSGRGTLRITIDPNESAVSYTLSHDGLEGNVTQAHIHLGRPAFNGGILVWLCETQTNLAPPGIIVPTCPQSGTVSGVITPSDVIGPAAQGVPAGAFDRFLAALRAEATYANVHSDLRPGGEVRGQVTFHAHGAAIR